MHNQFDHCRYSATDQAQATGIQMMIVLTIHTILLSLVMDMAC